MNPSNTPIAAQINDVSVVYDDKKLFGRNEPFLALQDVTLEVVRGEILGLVGESGSGKTTLGRAMLGLTPLHSGSVAVGDISLTPDTKRVPAAYRSRIQAVFQDPLQALNPMHTIERIVSEPLVIHRNLRGPARRAAVVELLELVGLPTSILPKRTSELSGGQRQRVAIARAIGPDPDVLVMDEAVSALDVTTTAQILGLMQRLRRPDSSVLFIAHDIALVRGLCDRVAVMRQGEIVEVGDAEQVCGDPQHPYTRLLVNSAPHPHPTTQAHRRAARLHASDTTERTPT